MWFTWKYAGKHVIFMKVWFTRRPTGKKVILVMHLSRSWYSSRHICRSTEFFIVSNFFTFMACSVFRWTFVVRIGLQKDWVFLFPLEFTAAKFVYIIYTTLLKFSPWYRSSHFWYILGWENMVELCCATSIERAWSKIDLNFLLLSVSWWII